MPNTSPTFFHEQTLRKKGYHVVAGVDEAGAGALAGPVVAAAVVLPPACTVEGIRDSKKLSATVRERLASEIRAAAAQWAIGESHADEINRIGIRPANYLAMRRAIEQIQNIDAALIDAWTVPDLSIHQEGIVRGDQSVKSIAAASILAKVHRDTYMVSLNNTFPTYGFDRHKGYGTAFHRDQILTHGPCPEHRTSWSIFSA